jgi:zinc transporter ZupT
VLQPIPLDDGPARPAPPAGALLLPPADGPDLDAGRAGPEDADREGPEDAEADPAAERRRRDQSWRRTVLLVVAVTMHNIPEGLAVGVAFAAAGTGGEHTTFGAARSLAIGIGIQNFPEGLAVSLPLRRAGLSRGRAFLCVAPVTVGGPFLPPPAS